MGSKCSFFYVFLFLVLLTVCTQSRAAPLQHVPGPPRADQSGPEDEARIKLERDMAKQAYKQRQAELKRDTDRLFKLASELKQYVDKTNENVMSVDVIKKAEAIEKLAHSVREKMRGSN